MKILISTTTFCVFDKKPLQALKSAGLTYQVNPKKRKLSKDEIKAWLSSSKAIGLIAGTETLDADVLLSAPQLKIISRVGVGIDAIDLAYAKKRKIVVYNTPAVLTDSVAELTIGLILSCLRFIPSHDREIRRGEWHKHMGRLFSGKTLGIIGFGRIGRTVAHLAKAFGVSIVYYDIKRVRSSIGKQVTLQKLLTISDVVSVHSSQKKMVISNKELRRMKKGVIVINTARGGCIDEKAFFTALKSGAVGALGIDVFENEPYLGKLKSLPNVVMTAHIGSYAQEARTQMEQESVMNLIKGLTKAGVI